MRVSLAAGVILLSACMLHAQTTGSLSCTFGAKMPIIEITNRDSHGELRAIYGIDGLVIDAVSLKVPGLISFGSLRSYGMPGGRYPRFSE